jgi:hypothetical protein
MTTAAARWASGARSELFLIDEEHVLPETPPNSGGTALGGSQDDLLDLEAAYQELTAALLRL